MPRYGIAGEVEVTGETAAAGLAVTEWFNALVAGIGVPVYLAEANGRRPTASGDRRFSDALST
jgi:hypothetical protein